jgi:TonB family protein
MILAVVSGLLASQSISAEEKGQAQPLRPRTPPGSWITNQDYPTNSVRNKEFGILAFRLDVDDKGDIAACHILVSSGFWRLDEQACTLLTRRARFEPARDAAGTPIPATYRSRFQWILPGSKQDYIRLIEEVAPAFDLNVSVNKLPANYEQPALIRARFGSEGMNACSVEMTSGNPMLDKIACQQAERDVLKPPYRKGLVTQPDTRMVSVTFVVDDEAK